MEKTALVPYLLCELIENLGGVVDLDADKVLQSIKAQDERGIAVSIIDGKLRLELMEKDEIE